MKAPSNRPTERVSIAGYLADLLHQGPVNGQEHYVVSRANGMFQIWTDDPPGASDGYPRCVVQSEDLNKLRAWWKANA